MSSFNCACRFVFSGEALRILCMQSLGRESRLTDECSVFLSGGRRKNEKCCGNASRQGIVFTTFFEFSQTFTSVFKLDRNLETCLGTIRYICLGCGKKRQHRLIIAASTLSWKPHTLEGHVLKSETTKRNHQNETTERGETTGTTKTK